MTSTYIPATPANSQQNPIRNGEDWRLMRQACETDSGAFHGNIARGTVTPARRGRGVKPIASTEVRSAAERHAAMTWAQRLKRVFNIDIEVCSRCGGAVKVIACIEDQDVIDRILTHLRDKEQGTPTLPHLVPPTRAPPETLTLFAGKDSRSTALNQQGSD